MLDHNKAYGYSEEGLLQEVTDRNGCALTISYQGQYPRKMTTALGYEVIFTFEEDRLVKLEDGMGRTTGYRYRDGWLAEVVHMDGGISRYDYTGEGYLTRPTDQTGLCYLENTYDEKGRVTLQTLANGETYRAEYLDRERKVCVEYSAYPGEKVYTYNEKMEITQVLYPDGTKETFAFDVRHNRILETDRMGRSIHKEYDTTGHLIKEIRPEGLETEYIYNHTGDLEIIRDNGGRQTILIYDENHNLTVRKQKTGEGSWSKESYAYDRMGRLTQEQDGEGHATRYCYEKQSAYPYRTIHADGSELVCEYDRSGRRLWEEDSAGRTEYGYNRSGWQTMVRDGEGNETHFLYDGMGRKLACYSPKQWKEKKGKRTEYRYDFLERLMDTEYADGSHEKLVRDGEGNILKEVHPNAYDPVTKDGAGTVYEYDGDNRLLRIRYPDGGVERFFYDGAGNRIKHVLPEQYDAERDDGEGWNYTYDEGNRLIAMTGPDGVVEETYAYDLWGNCVRKTDADGYTTHYTYDLEGRMIQKLEPSGESREDISYCKTVYTYDNNGNRIREIRYGGRYGEDGSLLEAGTDLILTFTYDAWNRLVRVEDGLGARASFSYDVRGNRVSEEQVIGTAVDGTADGGRTVLRRFKYIYDKAGRMIEKREIMDSGLAETNNRLEEKNNRENTETATTVTAVTRYGYDANGNRIEIVTPEGYHISRDYDERDRLIMERVEDKENGIDLKTYITYDRAGNILSVRQKGAEGKERAVAYDYDLKDRLTRAEEIDGPVIEMTYDKNDRIRSRKELLASEKEAYQKNTYNYNNRGNLTEKYRNGVLEERKRYDQKKRLIQNTDGDGVEVRCRYGIQDEQREIITANSRQLKRVVQKLSYNARGQITGVEDGCGAKTGYTLDGWGRITSIQTAEGGQEKYAYDYAGNIVQTTDANGGIIRYAYNSQGKVCAITDQSGKTETFRYDKEGRETEHTDRNGTVTQTRYNIYGQPVLKICTDAKGRREVMGTWEYDSFGQLKKSVAGGYCYTYEYRPDGKLLRKWSSGQKVIDCTYYRDGSLKSLWDVSGKSTIYEYDGQGYLKSLKDETGKVLTEYRYTKAGRLKEVLTPEGMNTTYGYDADGNLNRLTIGNSNDRTFLYDAFIRYDLNGNRTEKNGIRLSADGKEQKMATIYRYDAMNRLTEENRGGDGEKYAYDLNGNRLKKERYRNGIVDAVETYCYNERNELTEKKNTFGLITYSYDANGSLLSEKSEGKTSEYRYDLLNRLTYVHTLDGREQKNYYDGEGFRAGLKESGKASEFVFHNGEILAECNEENVSVRRHILGMGLSHMQTLGDHAYHTVHKDEQWSTAYITNESGHVENCYQYDAFGNLLESKESIPNRMLYTGQQYDQETGQYYLRARYYNPVIGRFTQEDIYRGDGLNLYAYCANNPVMYYDPSGYAGENCPPNNQAKVEQTKGSSKGGKGSTTGENSKILSNNLAREGRPVGEGEAAAHIVASTGSKRQWASAADSRNLLAKYNIDINDAANGIPLGHPRPHNLTHNRAFHEKVNGRLHSVETNMLNNGYGRKSIRSALRNELRSIGKEFENGIRN